MPVAELIPSILDVLGGPTLGRHRLSRVGCAPLPGSTTLAQNDIRDGAVLVLAEQSTPPPAPRHDDDAEAVAAGLKTTTGLPVNRVGGALTAVAFTVTGALVMVRNAFTVATESNGTVLAAATAALAALFAIALFRNVFHDPIAELTLAILATTFAAVAGLLAVPGVPGAPAVLLAAMATAVTAVLALRLARCGVVTLTALAGAAIVVALAALAAVLTGTRLDVTASVTAVACLGLIEMAPRMSMMLAGLSPGPARSAAELADRTRRAENWLTSLRAGFAAVAALGATTAACTAHRAIPLAALTGAALLLHARTDRRRSLVFLVAAIATSTTTLALAVAGAPRCGPWLVALTVTLTAAALYVGFLAPTFAPSPITRRGVDVLGCIALAAAVPLACWTCGAFSAVRALSLQP
ncbi:ESX-4 secretion system protein eccD4 [Mycobacterium kiyosense]|nr:ESX-4 secretion system protein eccD4 [Mycobacterium kiyosense]GLD42711.1 ESX-4 secretion system protein eccD4 [Mycobacterium kiyosense]